MPVTPEQDLVVEPLGEAVDQALDRLGLVARRLERGDEFEVGMPARNQYNPIIANIGVLPAHRGNGYVDEIFAEGTRVLAADNAPRIRASTASATSRSRIPSPAPATSRSNGRST